MIPEVPVILDELLALHEEKSRGYGSDQDPAHNFTAVATVSGEKKFHYPLLRMSEKLTRAINLYNDERYEDLSEELRDIALIAVIAEALRRQYVGAQARVAIPEKDPQRTIDPQLPVMVEPGERSLDAARERDDLSLPGVDFKLPDAMQEAVDAEIPRPGAVLIRPEKESPVGKFIDYVLADVGLCVSSAEARRMIADGHIMLNGNVIREPRVISPADVYDGTVTLQKGKRQEVRLDG